MPAPLTASATKGCKTVIMLVRGEGLFLGVELPDVAAAAAAVEHARAAGVLLSTDGPRRNELKIKPPLAVGDDDAELLVRRLDTALALRCGRNVATGQTMPWLRIAKSGPAGRAYYARPSRKWIVLRASEGSAGTAAPVGFPPIYI